MRMRRTLVAPLALLTVGCWTGLTLADDAPSAGDTIALSADSELARALSDDALYQQRLEKLARLRDTARQSGNAAQLERIERVTAHLRTVHEQRLTMLREHFGDTWHERYQRQAEERRTRREQAREKRAAMNAEWRATKAGLRKDTRDRHAQLRQDARAERAEFRHDARAQHAQFKQDARAERTEFRHDTREQHAQLKQDARAERTEFRHDAREQHAQFKQDARTERADLRQDVRTGPRGQIRQRRSSQAGANGSQPRDK